VNAPLYLTEADVRRLVTVADALEALEGCFSSWGDAGTTNIDRRRARVGGGNFNLMGATYGGRNVYGLKAYFAGKSGTRYHVLLYSAEDAALLAMIEADLLGALRTGAASGIATKFMAKAGAQTLAVVGTGKQALHQAAAIAAVRQIKEITVYSRTPERRTAFARTVEAALGIAARPAADGRACVEGVDVVATVTKSAEPVCCGSWLAEGVHINAAGANAAERRELDADAVLKAQVVATDSRSQAQHEAAEFRDLVGAGRLAWGAVLELGDIVSGKISGRQSDRQITLFKSLGVALEDVAFAELIYRRAVAAGAGKAF
jgi:ornithine cyclodeaminase/alanine dehydrogenase-like protein (mu-crystallin family)